MSVGLVGRSGTGLVLLDVVLSQEDPVLQVGQGGTEVVLLVGLPSGVESVTLGYTAVNVDTETLQILPGIPRPLSYLNGQHCKYWMITSDIIYIKYIDGCLREIYIKVMKLKRLNHFEQ